MSKELWALETHREPKCGFFKFLWPQADQLSFHTESTVPHTSSVFCRTSPVSSSYHQLSRRDSRIPVPFCDTHQLHSPDSGPELKKWPLAVGGFELLRAGPGSI